MLYLTTGGNGAGKTLLTLRDVRKLQLESSRPVAYNGRFEMVADFGWKKIDAKDWQAEPDGTIFFFDECHNDFPVLGRGENPDYVAKIAEHRRRGFDFFLITQHPMNLNVFIRRLIATPGWHRHLKKLPAGDLVSVLTWAAVNPQCEKPGSGDSGETKMVPYPKEVYAWYRSASLHTAKSRIPKQVFVLGFCVLLVPALFYYGFRYVTSGPRLAAEKMAAGVPAGAGLPVRSLPAAGKAGVVITAADYVAARMPRIEGLPQTAPVFDGVTGATVAPYPAACVDGVSPRSRVRACTCYTQQGTKLQVPEPLCRQIVDSGFFIEWHQDEAKPSLAPAPVADGGLPRPDVPAKLVAPAHDGSVLASMRSGNRVVKQ